MLKRVNLWMQWKPFLYKSSLRRYLEDTGNIDPSDIKALKSFPEKQWIYVEKNSIEMNHQQTEAISAAEDSGSMITVASTSKERGPHHQLVGCVFHQCSPKDGSFQFVSEVIDHKIVTVQWVSRQWMQLMQSAWFHEHSAHLQCDLLFNESRA